MQEEAPRLGLQRQRNVLPQTALVQLDPERNGRARVTGKRTQSEPLITDEMSYITD